MKKTKHTQHPEPTKVFDVRRPGKTSVSATSRPVIVGHRPQVQDPMVSHADSERRPLLDASKHVTIQPATSEQVPAPNAAAEPLPTAPRAAADTPEQPLATPELDAEAAADLATVAMKDTTELTDEPTKQQPTSPESTNSAPTPAATGDQAVTDDYFSVLADQPAHDEGPAVQTNTEPLPELPPEAAPSVKPQVFVSRHPKRKSGRIIVVILVVVLLAVIVLDVLLDAGFVTLDSVPHTTLF